MCILANIVFPVLAYFYLSLMAIPALFLFIIAVETAILFIGVGKQKFGMCLLAVSVANVASTIIGFILICVFQHWMGFDHSYPIKWWLASYATSFIMSVMIESPLTMNVAGKEMRKSALLGSVLGNALSYLGCGYIMAMSYLANIIG